MPTSSMPSGQQPGPLLGLFDIFQTDSVRNESPAEMYARRLDHLARADALGLAISFVAERHFLPTHPCPSATAWLAAASQCTARMRLGVLGYTLPIRTPVQLAEEIAVLDQLTAGRLEVGLGLGHRVEELIALGVDPGQRITSFQRRLGILRALWTGGSVRYDGDDDVLHDVQIAPLPVQTPHPPLWFAGTEPMGAQWMGQQGLGMVVGFKPTAALAPTIAAYRSGWESRSVELRTADPARPSGHIGLMRGVVIGATDEEARLGHARDILRLDEATGVAHVSGDDERLRDALARVDELVRQDVLLLGGPVRVATEIRRAQDALGFDLFLANVYAPGMDHDRIAQSLTLLAGPVRDALERS